MIVTVVLVVKMEMGMDGPYRNYFLHYQVVGYDCGDDSDDGDFKWISLFRDYVNSWYKGISHNPAFPDEVSSSTPWVICNAKLFFLHESVK